MPPDPPVDTVVAAPQAAPGDTIPVPDTLPVIELARITTGPPPGWATAVWVWDRDQLMGARDLTLLELLEQAAGLVALRGGDYGSPESLSALAMGGGRIRLYWDGFEMIPLDGAAPDLALVGLGGVEEVRLERGPGELRIHVESMRASEPRPYSLVEAGTGDLDTNFFRGTFLHPRVLNGILGLALERVDTRGPFRREVGSRPGGWLSWGRPIGDAFGVRLELRRMSRDLAAAAFPVGVSRSDWVARGRGRFLDDQLTAELFSGASSLTSDEGQGIVPLDWRRRQHGLRVAWEPDDWLLSGSGTLRLFGGPGLPSRTLEMEGGAGFPGVGGVHGRWSLDAWPGRDAAALTLQGWTEPFGGVSGFASFAGGARGAAIFPGYQNAPPEGEAPPETPSPGHRFTDLTTFRVGAAFRRESVSLEAAWISLDADSLAPLGLVLDRPGPVVEGGVFRGWEAQLRLPLPVAGFSLGGSVQAWDRGARYLPRTVYQASIDFHDVFLETGNLEVWGALGVRGRDAMLVPSPGAPQGEPPALARVPFYQSWTMDLQARVLTVHLFIRWENFTFQEELQDFPGRRLPFTRAIYGVKWIMWN